MTDPSSTTNRIEIEGEGVGEIDNDALQRRAKDIAASDGRVQPNEMDRIKACSEFSSGGEELRAPESIRSPDDLIDRNSVPGESGTQAVRQLPDDENTVPEQLVSEGFSEADHDRRRRGRRVVAGLTGRKADAPHLLF